MSKEQFEKLKAEGKIPANTIHIDMGTGIKEILTEGWTDTQIKNKTLKELDCMIMSGERGISSLNETLDKERERIRSLRRIRQRKVDLGD